MAVMQADASDPATAWGGMERNNRPVQIKTFGGFGLRINGNIIGLQIWKSQRTYQLLVALVALGGRNVPMSQLLDLLWPDSEGDKSMQNLEFNLRKLRGLLQELAANNISGNEIIRLHQGKLSLNDSLCVIDIWLWEDLCRQAGQLRREGDDLKLAFALENRACDLLHGDYFAGEADISNSWRNSWRQRCSLWLIQIAHAWRQCSHAVHNDTMRLLEIGLRLDPCSEQLCMHAMNALLDAGHTVDAMRVYYAWVERIKDEYGLRPSMKATMLANRIVSK